MRGWDIAWIAIGYLSAAFVGAVFGAIAGGYAIIKVLFKMHENSLPPKG
jgi:hypothetical protein